MPEYIDLYCERMGPGFWAEPVNALTNLFFIVAAWLAWRRAKSLKAISPGVKLLVALLYAIGVGSFLFHTFATPWAQLADVVPIMLFLFLYVWLYCREVVALHTIATVGVLLLIAAVGVVAGRFPGTLNGSLIYAPALLALLGIAMYHVLSRQKERYVLPGAAGLFVLSLTFRVVDNLLCPRFPLGTHFLWHICNSAVLYLALRGFLANRIRKPEGLETQAGETGTLYND